MNDIRHFSWEFEKREQLRLGEELGEETLKYSQKVMMRELPRQSSFWWTSKYSLPIQNIYACLYINDHDCVKFI